MEAYQWFFLGIVVAQLGGPSLDAEGPAFGTTLTDDSRCLIFAPLLG
jgi:hypothetical protein